jgi:hypothetical protein
VQDDLEAQQRLAMATRTLRLLKFRLLQLGHTNEQLLARLHDLIDQAGPLVDGDARPPPPSAR